ncbi:hypothetical protein KCTCHS21_32530 [Cohnella abietis]|uniref:Uncharacterized protein n=2 Tax=Cohnella abietis TaxID=2507935 RepID=A0A3T1D702_9BACL|nr:hypothetical protein KCTCHS21_32530 [Cohnella abietis]
MCSTVIIVVAIIILYRFLTHEKLSDYIVVNDGVVVTKQFSVKSQTAQQNTSAKGSIFVWGDKAMAKRMRIVTSFEIDPKDFGGMTIYIPKKWYIANILSSYPENQKTSLQPYASDRDMSSLGDDWRNQVEVGVTYVGNPAGGGTGTVIIDLVPDRKAILPSESFIIGVAVGSSTKGGVRSIGVDSIKIPISLDSGSKN